MSRNFGSKQANFQGLVKGSFEFKSNSETLKGVKLNVLHNRYLGFLNVWILSQELKISFFSEKNKIQKWKT